MKKLRIDFNAPIILEMTLVSFIILILSMIFGDGVTKFFSIHFTSWLDPLMYVRLFTHVFAHANWAHFAGNFMMILVVGPIIEEKYGSYRLAFMILVTALVTGLINIIFFPHIMLLGASGIVFMLILLSSFVNIREGKFPLTVILVAVFFIGNEITAGLFRQDNISQISHIIGGLCGGAFGIRFHLKTITSKSTTE